ncbi:hypothetical protein MRB53_029057 [Persea americana]|uniref:Uncharacterized protein n=1 Tax=Persea americana TaxID=3435 RepID=A0ACC2KHH8_PERAE|nr:hypothetical protein MRB53_029057 [Persea americana]
MGDFSNSFRSIKGRDRKLKIAKGMGFNDKKTSKPKFRGKMLSSSFKFNDAEMKRRKRVAGYKMYALEGKIKASFRKGFRWIKRRCFRLIHA